MEGSTMDIDAGNAKYGILGIMGKNHDISNVGSLHSILHPLEWLPCMMAPCCSWKKDMASGMVVSDWPGWINTTMVEYMNWLGLPLWLPCSLPSGGFRRFQGDRESNTAWVYSVLVTSESVQY